MVKTNNIIVSPVTNISIVLFLFSVVILSLHTTFCVYDLWRFSKHFLVGLQQTYLKAQSLNLPFFTAISYIRCCQPYFSFSPPNCSIREISSQGLLKCSIIRVCHIFSANDFINRQSEIWVRCSIPF